MNEQTARNDAKKQTMRIVTAAFSWISAAALIAAAACGILRRAAGVEPPGFITGWIMPVFTAAAVGYLTNWLAIQLLFRPYHETKLFGRFRVQGLIPKRKKELAETLAEQIPAKLMPPKEIAFQIRRKVREIMRSPELTDRLHAMFVEHIRDERRKQEFTRQIAAILDTAGAAGIEAGLTPSGVRKFYYAYGSGFVKEKAICNKSVRQKILDELKEQIPGLVREIRENMPGLIMEYMRDNPVKGTVLGLFTGRNGENLPWQKMEQAILNRLSEPDADRQIERKLAEFKSRLEGYLDSPELEADIADLKKDAAVGDTLCAIRDDLAGKLLDFLEDELVWGIIREQALPGIRIFLQEQILPNKDEIAAGLDLPGRIRKSILKMNPEEVHELVKKVSEEELAMLQALGFALGGAAGFLLVFAQ
jgi:uncharacterized membrane protein YheB (UPF0754 family)